MEEVIKTYSPKISNVQKKWFTIDCKNKVLGRVASKVVNLLNAKHKVGYAPHLCLSDKIILLNVGQVKVTGKKMKQKIKYKHSGFPGGLKEKTYEKIFEKNPEKPLRDAIKGMMANTPIRDEKIRHLYFYLGNEHNHHAQNPEVLEI